MLLFDYLAASPSAVTPSLIKLQQDRIARIKTKDVTLCGSFVMNDEPDRCSLVSADIWRVRVTKALAVEKFPR